MSVASLPGPVSGIWRLGPVAVHGYALCVVLGVLALLWLTERRYRAVGGRPWLMIDIATVAVPVGLVGARVYRIIIDYHRYFGHGQDWVGIFRIWDGGLGLPGAAVAGIAAACLWCRKQNVAAGPVLAAAAPGIAIGAAISLLGNWFAQSLYGPPATVPWAVPISPASRVSGYQDFNTFQPIFLYEAIWDFAVAVTLAYLIRRLSLTGNRALAICIGGYAVGMLGAQSAALTGPQQQSGMLVKQLAAVAVLAGAIAFLYATRARLGPEPLAADPGGSADPGGTADPGGPASGKLAAVPVSPAQTGSADDARDGAPGGIRTHT
ncbi:MAG TPA: prolipoprotein diacylglyceryl transferase family protein [Streptosporangiaceae bacterium]|nr:prolipoprotein diacylglyceryl transferase family protein [Streptosporangiaceae bacterium]